DERRIERAVAALAGVGQLIDEIDEEEQREEGKPDEADRRDDVRIEQPTHRFHAVAFARACRQPRLLPWSRHHNSPSAMTKALPCAPTSATPMPTLPPATQACIRLMML